MKVEQFNHLKYMNECIKREAEEAYKKMPEEEKEMFAEMTAIDQAQTQAFLDAIWSDILSKKGH